MALKVFILENSSTKKQRQTDIQNAVREYLKNPKIKVVFEENGKITLENAEKKLYVSLTRANKVMLVALYEKPIGIDGEYMPRMIKNEDKVDYAMLAQKFFSEEEADYMHESMPENEGENFLKIWVRKEAYIKAAGKSLVDFPKFSVVDGLRFLPKVNGISLKKFAIKFPECEDYFFVIAGVE